MYFERAKKLSKTLRFRLTLWNAGVVLSIALITLFVLRQGVRHTIVRESDQRLSEDLREVEIGVLALNLSAPEIRAATREQGPLPPRLFLDELDRKARGHIQHEWFIQLFDETGTLLWESVGSPDLPPPRASANQPAVIGDFRIVRSRSQARGKPPLIIRIGASTRTLSRSVAQIDQMVLRVGTIATVVGLLAGFWLTNRAIHPLNAIISTTARLHPRQLNQRLPLRETGDELDQLSTTINGLLDRIANYLQVRHDFLANSAHELRTPIAAIRSSAEVALGGARAQQEYEELLEEAITQCDALENLVNQLLLLAETENDDWQAHVEQVDLALLLKKSLEMFHAVAEFRGMSLTATMPDSLIIQGKPHLLRQLLNNLIDNALKFTERGGEVRIQLRSDVARGTARLEVHDTGAGIPEADLARVFDRFFRVDRSHSRAHDVRGTGLGLSICQAVVLAHGGQITVASQLGHGTTFRVVLPITRSGASQTSDEVDFTTHPTRGSVSRDFLNTPRTINQFP